MRVCRSSDTVSGVPLDCEALLFAGCGVRDLT